MAQIASLTVLNRLMVCKYLHFIVRGLIRETKLPMQELELKMQVGAYARGRGEIIAGF